MKELSLGAQLDRADIRLTLARDEMGAALEEYDRVRQAVLSHISLIRGIKITAHEGIVLDGIKRGLQNKEIASELECTVRAVKFHITNMLLKTGCENRQGLLRRMLNDEKPVQVSSASVVPIRTARARTGTA